MLRNTARGMCAALFLALTVAAQDKGPSPLPDTEAGRRVAAYLKAFNSGDDQQLRAFFREHVAASALERRPVELRVEANREMRGEVEGFTTWKLQEARADSVKLLAQTKRGAWAQLTFAFEPSPPHKLLAIQIEEAGEAGGGGPPEPSTPLKEAEALAAVERSAGEAAAADEFSGTVLVAKGGRVLFQKAYGLASREYDVPNRPDTKFNLGSINKLFTQVVVGQLAGQGKLSFDDTIGKHLPDYPNRDAAAKVTIRQLLTMSSGIGDFFGERYEATPKDRLRTIKDYLRLFADQPLRFEPGSKREYSNGGYVVLGAIVEKLTGRDYFDYVREHVFEPAGMRDTGWYEADAAVPHMASGYTTEGARGGAKRRNNIYLRPAKGSPAGGGYSTAPDLLKFGVALQTGKLRMPNFRQPPQPSGAARAPEGFSGVGFAGGAEGINAVLDVGATEREYTVVVMSNYDPPSANKLAGEIRRLLGRVKE